ncbi:helix-turn-helix domain-containing protein [Photorhabdus laumondii subsp. laumondii]|uniref:Photorhabdus luminescens subsp. laumondii TTO1 complete genome segment 7/17 n=5 Tax=Photorhabdus TaxID=29487 RepID=Q7N5L7_PHOLL|nr:MULTISPECIES: helix-turn-helix transcriptional regulator [Photorhabdus]PQQ32650.1 XRE family transcriptional regulator [Photorhabdus luminescens]AWK41734.1 transcriptional regulator [Photorhabdus laumondii subsp. laumondii]AXG42554.1 XRE family transcriptional regulator [Photorhabdus laumondii subsp. laumondii]AXG47056.1 XRE family transcriptional regulator [Photorhabdus laumondii subsp. laumondii]KTL60938.1 hydroxyacid dehydrogenase [Photorhabdus laumondii subsp. laumondii]
MASIQFITDEHGKKQAVILPMDEYERLLAAADHDENYQIIPYTTGPNDDETIPHEVVSIMVDDEVSLQAAWRIYRGLSQAEVAEKLGIKQAAVSQFEKSDRPRKATIEKLADLYDCRISQLVLD